MNYREIQDDVIKKYRITIDEHSHCRGRMHAHIKERKVCKWHPKNSYAATFDLLHEIGHIENNSSGMRRAEQEYYATVWAIDRLKDYGIDVQEKSLFSFQRYILTEIKRGERRGGKAYGELSLYKYVGMNVTNEDVYNRCDQKWKDFIDGIF